MLRKKTYVYTLHIVAKGGCSPKCNPAFIQVSSGASRIINLRRSCRSAWSAIGMVGLGNTGPRAQEIATLRLKRSYNQHTIKFQIKFPKVTHMSSCTHDRNCISMDVCRAAGVRTTLPHHWAAPISKSPRAAHQHLA